MLACVELDLKFFYLNSVVMKVEKSTQLASGFHAPAFSAHTMRNIHTQTTHYTHVQSKIQAALVVAVVVAISRGK